MHLLILWFSTA